MSKYDGYIPVLDKGYVKLIEHWGGGEAKDHESGIIEAARQSTDGNFKGWDNDAKLLKYLWDHKHCFDAQTEVLTDRGFVAWPDVRNDDLLYTHDPETDSSTYECPSALQVFAHSGAMYQVTHGGVDLCVTPNHKLYVKRIERKPTGKQGWQNNWGLETAESLGNHSMIRYRKHSKHSESVCSSFDHLGAGEIRDRLAFASLCAFFIGDGHAGGTDANGVTFHLKKQRKIDYLMGLCSKLGWVVDQRSSGQFVVRGDGFRTLFRNNFYEGDEKSAPDWFVYQDAEFCMAALEGFRESDGSVKRGAWTFSTTSEFIREAFQIIAVHAGESVSVGAPTLHDNPNHKPLWRLMVCSRMREPVINQGKVNTSQVQYNGKVYCATTRTGVLMVRRNGKICLSGNSTPFEFAGAVFEVQAPIMVFREWHRHRTQVFNEVSARYVEMKPMFYIPSDERLAAGGQSKTNKQASGQPLDADVVSMSRTVIEQSGMRAYQEYQTLLDHGVARELARLVLPVNIYSRMRVAANLRNWCAFLTLREAPNAQWEIRQFAGALAGSLATIFPHVLELHQASRAT